MSIEQKTTDPRGKFVHTFTRDGFTFEIFETPNGQYLYAGYCNGEHSVSASRADIAMNALVRKHITGLPKGEVVNFADAKASRA